MFEVPLRCQWIYKLPEMCPSLAVLAWVYLFLAPKVIAHGNRTLTLLTSWFSQKFFSLADFVFVSGLCTVVSYSSLMAALIENLIFMVDHLMVTVEEWYIFIFSWVRNQKRTTLRNDSWLYMEPMPIKEALPGKLTWCLISRVLGLQVVRKVIYFLVSLSKSWGLETRLTHPNLTALLVKSSERVSKAWIPNLGIVNNEVFKSPI